MSRYNEQYVKLDELGKVGRGKSKHRPRNDSSLFGGNYPFIQTGDVRKAEFYLTEFSETYNEKGLAQSKLWDKDTLCITIAANIAENAILGIKACFPDSIIGFLPDKKKADLKFIKYCLDTYKIQIQSISQGATQDNLSLEKLRSINFLVPELSTQKMIGSVLFNYDQLIENNTKRIAILEQMAEQIYKEWFVRMRFPGHQNTKFIKGIPEGWEVKKISDICNIMSGGTPSTKISEYWDGSIPFFTPKDVPDSFYCLSTIQNITETGLRKCNSKLYPKNTIMLTARGTVGKISLLNTAMAMNQSCFALSSSEFSNFYLFMLLRAQMEAFKKMANGATFDSIVLRTFDMLKVVHPPKGLINQYADITAPIFNELSTLAETIEKLTESRNLLLPRLISGKLSVEKLSKTLQEAV